MSLVIQIGSGAVAKGICCVAIGDNTVARGAFQVNFNKTINIPNVEKRVIVDILDSVKDMNLTFSVMAEQKHAPSDFALKADEAISYFVTSVENYFKKTHAELRKEVDDEAATSRKIDIPVVSNNMSPSNVLEVKEDDSVDDKKVSFLAATT